MAIDNALAGIAVRDVSAAAAWYQRFFGRPHDSAPMPTVAEWKFPNGGWLQVFEDPARAGKSSVTLAVSDIEQELARLTAANFTVGELTTSEIVKIAIQRDPDGNQIILAEALTDKAAQ